MADNRTVLCMKWGKLYSADYVNVLFNACSQHLAGDFQFLCLTDDATGFLPGIEARPIPDIGCSAQMWKHGAWPKLSVFSSDLYGMAGRILFIDLDTVVCGDLNPFFDCP